MASIALITSHAPSLVSFRKELISRLSKRGLIVYACAPNISGSIHTELTQLGAIPVSIILDRHDFNPFNLFTDILTLSRLLRRLKVQIAFGYFLKPSLVATFAALFAGVPNRFFMVEGLGSNFAFSNQSFSFKKCIKRFIISSSLRLASFFATGIIFLNIEDRDLILSNLPFTPKKTLLLGGIGVDLSYWIPSPTSQDGISFVFASRLLEAKGYRQFVKAALKVKTLYPETKFYLLGDIDENSSESDRMFVHDVKESGTIIAPGHVNVLEWLHKSSVFVFPTMYREGVPACLQEACACALPIITSNYPGCNITVDSFQNGIFIDPFEVDSIAKAMIFFVENPSYIDSFGQHSRMLAESRFDAIQKNSILINFLLESLSS